MIKSAIVRFAFVAFLLNAISITGFAQRDSLRSQLLRITKTVKGDMGIAVMSCKDKDTLSVHGSKHLPMQSVFKFHLALAVLAQVDEGKLSLEQKIPFKKSDIIPDSWSPLAKKYPEGGIDITLSELLSFSVSQSDNSACDMLFKIVGGPSVVHKYIQSLGVMDVSIVSTEAEMHKNFSIQYRNWTTAAASVQLLHLFYKKNILSKTSKDFLWRIMVETSTGPKRIKESLPPGTTLAHKTGTGGITDRGAFTAVNDIGVMVLPNGNEVALSVFISNATAKDMSELEKAIAQVSNLVYAYYAHP